MRCCILGQTKGGRRQGALTRGRVRDVAARFPSLLRMNCTALATAAVGKALRPTLARQAACPTGWQAALARGQPSLLLPFAAGIPAVLPVDLAGHATADSNAIDVRSTRRFSRTCANRARVGGEGVWVVRNHPSGSFLFPAADNHSHHPTSHPFRQVPHGRCELHGPRSQPAPRCL